jgi:hypothetical protein
MRGVNYDHITGRGDFTSSNYNNMLSSLLGITSDRFLRCSNFVCARSTLCSWLRPLPCKAQCNSIPKIIRLRSCTSLSPMNYHLVHLKWNSVNAYIVCYTELGYQTLLHESASSEVCMAWIPEERYECTTTNKSRTTVTKALTILSN